MQCRIIDVDATLQKRHRSLMTYISRNSSANYAIHLEWLSWDYLNHMTVVRNNDIYKGGCDRRAKEIIIKEETNIFSVSASAIDIFILLKAKQQMNVLTMSEKVEGRE